MPLDLPDEFVLILNPDQPNDAVVWPDDLDGPFLMADAVQQDDALVFLPLGGLPYGLLVTKQDGNRLTLADGDTVRVEPWPLEGGNGDGQRQSEARSTATEPGEADGPDRPPARRLGRRRRG